MREMKESGLPWANNVPSDWDVIRGKNTVKKLKRPVKETDGVITCFRDGEVTLRSKRREEGFTFSDLEVGYQGIEPGDLVIHGMDGFAGAIGISDSRGKGTPVLNVLESKNDKRFLMYYFRAIAKCGYFESVATGIRVRTCDTNWNKIAVTPCLVPPLVEQSHIAAFLDERCGKIDEAIAKHKALIEKLDEYRKAVITKAVTKGVRGDREMKESGIDWVGQIPADWSMQKMLWMCKTITDYVASGSFADLAENVTYRDTPDYAMLIRTTDISNKGTSLKHVYVDKHSYDFLSNSNLFGGEVVLPNVGSVGEAYIVPTLYERMTLGPNAIVVRASKRSNDRFLYYFFNSYVGSLSLINLAQVTTQPKFNKTNFRALRGICPLIEEQAEIVAFLDEKCAAIDSVKERHQQLIAKLEEYKKSLIYNAVTGKIEC